MDFTTITEQFQSVKQLPLKEEDGFYKFHEETLGNYISKINEVAGALLEDVDSQSPTFTELNRVANLLDNMKTELLSIRIPKAEITNYLKSKEKSDNIEHYKDIREDVKIELLEIVDTCEEQNYTNGRGPWRGPSNQFNNSQKSSANTRLVLHRDNPFADVSIETQQFLYPDDTGQFQTLSFKTGHTLSKQERDDKEFLVLQPGFKVSRSTSRMLLTADNTISIDDSISTQLPESYDDDELIYI